jgi:hypothetical protein
LCIQKAHEGYNQRLEQRGRAIVAKCESLMPAFLSMMKEHVTADSLERNRGSLFLPVQPGCLPIFTQALFEKGVIQNQGEARDLDCSCMVVMSSLFGITIYPASLSSKDCTKALKYEKICACIN